MKTSNKILLGAFLLCLLVLTAIHMGLYAKYKNGDFTYINRLRNNEYKTITPDGIRRIHINGLNNITIFPSDTLSFNFRKIPGNPFYYTVKDSTLFLQPDSSLRTLNSGYPLDLHLPAGVQVAARESALFVNGATDSLRAASQTFTLQHSVLTAGPEPSYFGQLIIHAEEESQLTFNKNVSVSYLDAFLTNSSMDDDMARFEKFSLTADDSSKVNLSAGNLKKLNLTLKH